MILLRKIRCFLFGHIASVRTHPLFDRDASLLQLMCPRCMKTFDNLIFADITMHHHPEAAEEWVLRTLPKRTKRKILRERQLNAE